MDSKSRLFVAFAIFAMVILAGGVQPNAEAMAYQSGCTNPGCLDATFGSSGWTVFSFDPIDTLAPDVAVQPDGGILVLGRILDSVGGDYSALRRLTSAGDFDTSFGDDGWLPLPFTDQADPEVPERVIVVPDLEFPTDPTSFDIIVVAEVTTGKTKGKWNRAVGVARLNSDMTLVSSFGDGGQTIFHFADGVQSLPTTAIVDSAQRIIVVGVTADLKMNGPTPVALARLNADGTFDTSFGGDGTVVSDALGYPRAVKDDVLGDLVLAVSGDFGDPDALIRFTSDGERDPGFGAVDPGIALGFTTSLAIDEQTGRILVSGELETRTETRAKGKKGKPTVTVERDVAIAAFSSYGAPDSSFGNDGIFSYDLGGEFDGATGLGLYGDGRVVCSMYGSDATTTAVMLRLEPDGSLDTSFGAGGIVYDDLVGMRYPGLVLTPATIEFPGIVLFGEVGTGEDFQLFVARYFQ